MVTNVALTCGNMQNEACVASISQSGLSHPASYGNDGSNVGMFVQSGAVTLGTPIIEFSAQKCRTIKKLFARD